MNTSTDKTQIHKAQHGTITAFYWSQDGNQLAVVDTENRITLYPMADLQKSPVQVHVPASGQLGKVAFHPAQPQFAVSNYQKIKVFDAEKGDLQYELEFPDYVAHSVAYSPDARFLGVTMCHHSADPYGNDGNNDGTFGLWDMQHAKWVLLRITTYPATTVCFDAPTNHLIWTTTEGVVYLWDMTNLSEIGRFHQPMQTLIYALPTFLGEAILIEQSDDYSRQHWVWHPMTDRVERLSSLQKLTTFVTPPDEPLYFVLQDDHVVHNYTVEENDIPLPPSLAFRYQFHYQTHIWDAHRNRIVYTLRDFRSGSDPLALHVSTHQLAFVGENNLYVIDLRDQTTRITFVP